MTDQINKAAAFEMGWAFAFETSRKQSREDSRAIGRLLFSDTFAPIHNNIDEIIKRDGFNSFESADCGIVRCKAIIHEALNALPPVRFTREDVEKAAVAIAKSDGLDYHEVCGVVADPDEGYCDSSTCVAACFEDHDPDQARGYYRHHATAALSAIGEVEHG